MRPTQKQIDFILNNRNEILTNAYEQMEANSYFEYFVNENYSNVKPENISKKKGTLRSYLIDFTKKLKADANYKILPISYKLLWCDSKTYFNVKDAILINNEVIN